MGGTVSGSQNRGKRHAILDFHATIKLVFDFEVVVELYGLQSETVEEPEMKLDKKYPDILKNACHYISSNTAINIPTSSRSRIKEAKQRNSFPLLPYALYYYYIADNLVSFGMFHFTCTTDSNIM